MRKILLDISQNSQENILKASDNFIKETDSDTGLSCEFFKISKNSLFYRTCPVAASEIGFSLHFRCFSFSVSIQILLINFNDIKKMRKITVLR